jgi:predicted transcriptional regulator
MPKRRTLKEIRKRILGSVHTGSQSIREISRTAGVDWYTVERQLTYLKGLGLVREVFRHKLLRLFTLTELGEEAAGHLGAQRSGKDKPHHNLAYIKRKLW